MNQSNLGAADRSYSSNSTTSPALHQCCTTNFAKSSHVYQNCHFFDVGLVNELAHRGTLKPGSLEYGAAFEHFIFMELRAYTSYKGGQPSIT